MAETQQDERTEQATTKRLDDARRRGQIPRSRELSMASVLMTGALVRLRLPGAGAMLARVTRSDSGRIAADFVNPVPAGRLDKTIGMATRVQRVA